MDPGMVFILAWPGPLYSCVCFIVSSPCFHKVASRTTGLRDFKSKCFLSCILYCTVQYNTYEVQIRSRSLQLGIPEPAKFPISSNFPGF